MKQHELVKCTAYKTFNVAVKWADYDPTKLGRFSHGFVVPVELFNWGNAIVIWGKGTAHTHRPRHEIIQTMCHELGHANHFQAVVNTPGVNRHSHFHKSEDRVCESYANAFEYYLLSKIYDDTSGFTWGYNNIYTGVGHNLLTHGIAAIELQNSVSNIKTWSEWRTNVKNLNVIGDNLVDYLFDNESVFWRGDIRDSGVYGQDFGFIGDEIKFIFNKGITTDWGVDLNVVSWGIDGVEGVDYNISTSINLDTLKIKFNNIRDFNITCNFRIGTGNTFPITKKIRTGVNARLSGNNRTQIGQTNQFILNGDYGSVVWNVDYKASDSEMALIQFDPQREWHALYQPNSRSTYVSFFKPGIYYVRAQVRNSNGRFYTIASKEISVTGSVNTYPRSEIKKFRSWFGNLPLSKSQYYYADRNRQTVNYYGMANNMTRTEDRETSFAAWVIPPGSEHVDYTYLQPIYRNKFLNSFGYSKQPSASNDIPIFHLLTRRRTGMDPIYIVENSKYVDEKAIYHYQYLTKDNLVTKREVTSWVWNWWGTHKVRDRNWIEVINHGLAGYAYPYGHEIN